MSFPFMAPSDGFVTARASAPANAVSYGVLTDNSNAVVGSGYTEGGLGWATTFPVVQGRTYKLVASSNVNMTYTFHALY